MNKAFWLLLLACPAAAEPALDARVLALAEAASRATLGTGLRAEIDVGRLDVRLKLAPCTDVRPYLPPGVRLWGPARIGLRCHDAAVRWNVFLPIDVKVYGPALVATSPLPSGHVLAAADLRTDEVLLSASPVPAVTQPGLALGRALAKPLAAGDALRSTDLRARQYFAAGDTVRVVAAGNGWRIAGEGQALSPGVEGRPVRVRTESGRVVDGVASGEREVEVAL
ncbi:MAG TPA: flagellar basal body P-ring formation chaperone FlgA [Burkholderiaceae bacterium]|nr:flagellar basal body P-ring formation chaperone FlgA [Burkholderiaceae bacterium]